MKLPMKSPEVADSHYSPTCSELGHCNVRVLSGSLAEYTVTEHIVPWKITVQLQVIDLIIYITLNQSGCMDAFALGGFMA